MAGEPNVGACLRWNITETADVHELRGLVGECIVARTTLELTTSASGRVALLRGSVDERFRGRGFGTMMLRWAAAVAGGVEGSSPVALRIDLVDAADDATALFEASGYQLALAEDELECDVLSVEAPVLRPHMTAQPWSADLSREFFHVYQDAFSDRPGFRVAGEPQWRAAFATSDAFRPGLSLLLRSGRQPVAFTICEAVSEHVGRIRQMGICAGWRRRGLADRLMALTLAGFRDAGLAKAVLSVNVDNPLARRAYERIGFRAVAQCQSYRKLLN